MNWMLWSLPSKPCCITYSTGHAVRTQSFSWSVSPTLRTCQSFFKPRSQVELVTPDLFTSHIQACRFKPFWNQEYLTSKSLIKTRLNWWVKRLPNTQEILEEHCKLPREPLNWHVSSIIIKAYLATKSRSWSLLTLTMCWLPLRRWPIPRPWMYSKV